MNEKPVTVAPPRLLLGVTLLFWGALSGHPVAGLVCAFAVEARWWTTLRWNTSEVGFVRAWHLSIVMLVIASAWLWLVGEGGVRLFDLLVWMPVQFLPVILVQQYATAETMPLNTFSFVARRKMQSDRAVGRPVDPIHVHVGYAYLCLVLLSSALSEPDEWISFGGMVVVGGVALYFSSPVGRQRPFAWGAAVLVVTSVSFWCVLGMKILFALLSGASLGITGNDGVGDEARTAIGSIGEIKQSHRIRWRVSGAEIRPFTLLRTASFNRYGMGIWIHRPGNYLSRDLDYDEMFEGGDEFLKIWSFRQEDLASAGLLSPGLQIRGEAREKTPLPLPQNSRILRDLEVDGVTWNPLGTVVAQNPAYSVIDFGVVRGEENLTESPPNDKLDLYVPSVEAAVLERTCFQLGFWMYSDVEMVRALRMFYRNEFEYSLDLKAGPVTGQGALTAITGFLEERREGHCEYYATATALLLRAGGVPTRYCEGFSAQERDGERDEWLLRGSHAHAWCRAYLGGRREQIVAPDGTAKVVWSGGEWVDVDLTPPAWLSMEGGEVSGWRMLFDRLQRAREDFLLWRVQPGNRQLVDFIMVSIAVLLVAYVAWRAWGTRIRRRKAEIAGFREREDVPVTPLHSLERIAERRLGSRPVGMALTRWLLGLEEVAPGEGESLRRAMMLHWKIRFDPLGAADAERQELEHLCRDLRKRLRKMKR